MATERESRSACQTYEALLEDYLHAELSGEGAKLTAAHLASCAACREAVEQAKASMRLLRAAEPSADPGPAFARVVMARIRSAENEKAAAPANFWQPFVSLGWRFAATATFALAALVTYNAGWGHRPQPNVVMQRPTIDIFAPEPARAPATGDEVLMMVADTSNEKQ
jgi:anti-sigma factor RsiW